MCDCSKDLAAIEAEQCRLIAEYIPRYLEEQRLAREAARIEQRRAQVCENVARFRARQKLAISGQWQVGPRVAALKRRTA